MAAALAIFVAGIPVDPLLPGGPGVLRGHTDAVTALAYSGDGALLASAGRDGSIRVWSAFEGTPQAKIGVQKTQINALAFGLDNAWVAAGDVELKIVLVDLATGGVKKTFAFPDAVLELAVSPNGAMLVAVGPSGNAVAYDTASGAQLKGLKLRGRSVRFSGDGTSLALGLPGGGIELVDVKTGKITKKIATGAHAPMVTLSREGTLAATWNAKDRSIHLWNTAKGKAAGELAMPKSKEVFEDAGPGTLTSLAMTGDGAMLIGAYGDRRVRVWNVAKKRVIATFPLERQGVVAVNPDGKSFAVADGTLIKVWPLPAF